MKPTNLSEYILLPREVRIAHIQLSSPCDCQGREKYKRQSNRKLFAKLCEMHGIANDVESRQKAGVNTCHLCENKHCHNPHHAYIGTAKENQQDKPKEQRSEAVRRGRKKMTPEQNAEALRKRLAARTPQQRSESAKKANVGRMKRIEVTDTSTGITKTYESLCQAARVLNLNYRLLSMVCLGQRQTTGGYTARYVWQHAA